jgi:hypothetical protein
MSTLNVTTKPVEIQAIQWTGENRDEVLAFVGESLTFGEAGTPLIPSLEGELGCLEGDMIVKDGDGCRPCPTGTFLASYATESIAELQATLEKHWNKAEREAASASDWAVPHKKKLRIDDAKHVKLAWDMVSRTGGLSDEERATARKRILAKAHKLGVDTSGWSKGNISKEDIDNEMAIMDDGSAAFVMEFPTPEEAAAANQPSGDQPRYFTVDEMRAIAAKYPVPGPVDVFNYLLTHVGEEASEFIWAISKVKRYGFFSSCPKTGESNRDKMIKELAELQACLELLNEELEGAGLPPIVVSAAQLEEAKQERIATLQMEHGLGRFTTGSEG